MMYPIVGYSKVFCQDLSGEKIFVYVQRAGVQAAADRDSLATIVLIAVFLAALAFGLLFLLGTKRQTMKANVKKEPQTRIDRPPSTEPAVWLYGLQAIIDIMGDGIEIAFARMGDGIVFILDVLINLFKWISRIDR